MQQNNEYLGGFSRPAEVSIGDEHVHKLGDLGIAEAASPISSRPPATANFEDMMRVTAEAAGGSGGGATGNRWPRQETMALLRIRSEMDSAFRDASPKGPLWEQVSRKLAELGYKRNGKKCKEKFENVHKYYKRTKEGRTGRQDGKSYKFFTELEALHQTTPTPIATPSNPPPALPMITNNPPPLPVSLPPISLPPPVTQPQPQPQSIPSFVPQTATPTLRGTIGISFSSDSSSSSEGEKGDEGDDHEDIEMESADTRKRKRPVLDSDIDDRMMKFFEDLMRQVMQKQESMQQKFIEAIEKREQDRMIREEAWKRQDMARLNREHELMAQERAISASRDSAIITFLQKITGQTIHFPTSQVHGNPPPPPPTPVSAPPPSVQPPVFHHQPQQTPIQSFEQQHQQHIPENIPSGSQNPETSIVVHQQSNTSTEIVVAVPEQIQSRDMTPGSASSRWPKTEVIALIQLRSGMETRYQEAGPKGPLWEEISAGMQRIGYNRNPKRCKEKWENINKYFKKVKESKKTRPEDAKTCPYFHELDALYRKKETSGIVIGGSGPAIGGKLPEQQMQQMNVGSISMQQDSRAVTGGENQPEDIVRKQHQQINGNLVGKFCNNIEGSNSENPDDMNYEEVDENEEYDDETEEDMKMAYKIQFQRQNVGSSNGNAATSSTSFLAMVQ